MTIDQYSVDWHQLLTNIQATRTITVRRRFWRHYAVDDSLLICDAQEPKKSQMNLKMNQFEVKKSLYSTVDAVIKDMNLFENQLYKGERCQKVLYDNNDDCKKCHFGSTPNFIWR